MLIGGKCLRWIGYWWYFSCVKGAVFALSFRIGAFFCRNIANFFSFVLRSCLVNAEYTDGLSDGGGFGEVLLRARCFFFVAVKVVDEFQLSKSCSIWQSVTIIWTKF